MDGIRCSELHLQLPNQRSQFQEQVRNHKSSSFVFKRSKKKYKGKARNVKPFYQPDLLITPIENLKVEQRNDAPTLEKRIGLHRKNQSVVVEIKFAQDTNESRSRKSVSKLKELADDYGKDKTEGHRNIILVFFEKGEKSYLTEDDVQMRLNELKESTVFHIPKESRFS